jgi:hypothetical protein
MHCLVGTFLKEGVTDERNNYNGDTLYALKIILPPNKSRVLYVNSSEDLERWSFKLKEAAGYSNIYDFYDMDKVLGKG